MDISDVAKRSGVAPSALRFYERQGLIAAVGRRGLRRQFDEQVLVRLGLIVLGRQAGFSLEEMARLFGSGHRPRLDRRMLADKVEELDRTIRRLRAIRSSLRHAIDCPAPSHMECPTFRRVLSAAMAHGAEAGRTPRGPSQQAKRRGL